jgi:hypothetical protein
VYHTLIERWNGTRWKRSASADPGDSVNSLAAVAARSAGDVWAVGTKANDGAGFETLTEHLSGGTWTAVPSPNPGDQENQLIGVASTATDDVWAVGFKRTTGHPRRTLIEHWNGSSWKALKSPSVGSDDNLLYGVTALAADDVWAVGVYSVPWFQTLVLHWNGSKWKVVASPNVGEGNNFLYDVAPTGVPGELLAVGSSLTDTGTATLAVRWNGAKWKVTPTPSPDAGFDELLGVATAAPGDAWAVGHREGTVEPFQTLGEHWDGSTWSLAATPNQGSMDNDLYDVAAVPGTGDLWAVGKYLEPGTGERTLVERYC